MKTSDMLTMLTITVLGGVAVYAIKRKLEGDPITFNAVMTEIDQEKEDGVLV